MTMYVEDFPEKASGITNYVASPGGLKDKVDAFAQGFEQRNTKSLH